jgi:capsular exopolysaccharide synthesis family protein
MDDIKKSLDEQSTDLVGGLKNRYEQLLQEEKQLAKQVADQRAKLLDLKDRAISYNILKREWEANKELYSGLLEKQKDVSVAAGMETNNISVVDKATIPTDKDSPKTKRNVAIAGVFGGMGGIGIAFLLAFLDNTFKNREELERELGLPFLGLVPKAEPFDINGDVPLPLLAHHDPTSSISEASRSIRTNVLFSRPENVPKKILITSTTSGEGKSTIASNLALVLAQGGSRVLLMEADLRRPGIAEWMDVEPTPGLTEYLTGEAGECLKATPFDNLYCVPAGRVHSNPTDLLGSLRMDDYLRTLSNHFDFIILDGPPILGLADSMILSSKVDGVLLVVKAGSTEKEAAGETVKRLRTINAPLIGSILNYVDLSQREYGYYKNYYYSYGGYSKNGYGGERNMQQRPQETEDFA